MSGPVVTALNFYPIKSCAGTPLEVADIGPRGILHDREFMLTYPNGRFITQRELPHLAQIHPTLTDGTLALAAPGMSPVAIEPTDAGPRQPVVVWRDTVLAVDQGPVIADWLSSFLETPVRLMRMPADTVRRLDPQYAPRASDQVGFADGYPLLLISEESLDDLNSRLASPLPMNRFRPNVVVRGASKAYAEDEWADLSIGAVRFNGVKTCARCAITTTDQVTAERGLEPLATLANYRRIERGVLFGQNLVHAAPGRIAIGDVLTVHAYADPPTVNRSNRPLSSATGGGQRDQAPHSGLEAAM
ncbi:MAG: MOSC domain-containing protein [Chloroflexi bacterium]|nr:MOSC domain-containing protein [Chloroflexota bacterium]